VQSIERKQPQEEQSGDDSQKPNPEFVDYNALGGPQMGENLCG